jgi:ATP-binding protein involved in chromosome partitioning
MNPSPRDEIAQAENRVHEAMSRIPHKILVMSGKGGVGKTTVAVNLAFAMADQGLEVGLLDVDLHGPNVALMAGVEGQQLEMENDRMKPIRATPKVRVLSIAFFLPHPDAPIAWRGPRKSGAIRQLLADGDWDGVDVLIVDCPPGTGDEPMSVAQLINDADGAIVVTSPQDVSLLDSRKCVGFVGQIGLKMLGIVENLSGFVCPSCGERVDLFKTGGGERAAQELGVPFLGRIPLSAAMVEAGDSGKPLVASHPEDAAALAIGQVADKLQQKWK